MPELKTNDKAKAAKLLTVEELSEALGVDDSWVYRQR